jgi:prepilin peptidase CpaA
MQGASELTLYAIIIVAVVQDFKYMRISNRLIVVGIVLSVAFGIFLGGVPRIISILLNISFPVIVLYLLYLLGVLGAGDIKLFSVVGGFTNFKTLTGCMFAAFIAAAVFSFLKMLYNKNLGFSLFKGQLFVKEVLQGNISSYRKTRAEERNLIHFSAAILIGLLIVYH